MSSSFYDVVVLGRRVGCLVAAALLAKRGFRVCVLGQGEPEPTFASGDRALPRNPFAFEPTQSPAARRIVAELALGQAFRRQAEPCDPSFQVVLPETRLDFWADEDAWQRDVDRQFPEVSRTFRDFQVEVSRATAALDRMVEQDLVWPPGSFSERRRFSRARSVQLVDRSGHLRTPLDQLADQHPLSIAVRAVARFSDGMDPDVAPALRRFRPWSHWLREPAAFRDGEATLRTLLAERLETYGGEFREKDKAEAIKLRRSHPETVVGVAGGDEIGAGHVIVGCDAHRLLRMVSDRRGVEELLDRYGEPQRRYFRYTLVAALEPAGVPPGLGRFAFVVADPARALHSDNLLRIENRPGHEETLIIVEALLPRRLVEGTPSEVGAMRDRVRTTLRTVLPYFEEHLRWLDSPHDGRPPETRTGPAPEHDEPWTRGPQWMSPIFAYPVNGPLGVCALPCRTPNKRLLLCNGQVVPGLGLEGDLLAALSCARIVTRSNRRLTWMRRGLWTKAEI